MSQRTLSLLGMIVVIVALSIFVIAAPGIGSWKEFKTVLGLDLQGGVQALLEADLPAGSTIKADEMSSAMKTAATIVENRVNGLGVTEAVVQQAGSNRIVVELPGATDPEKAVSAVQQTGLLEFVDFSALSPQEASGLTGKAIKTDYGLSTSASSSITATATLTPTARLYHTIMTGAELKQVTVEASQGSPVVAFELSSAGSKIFSDYTSSHVGSVLAIVLDKKVISAPTINTAITEGKGIIQGQFTNETANQLAVQLRYGSLPIPLKVVEVRTIGPTLGQDSLRKSLIAGIAGFIIIVLFMLLYYRLSGAIADLSIIIYALIAFAVFRFIPITLTLPGIAGFMLSTGSALDANILIFERFKEELRAGRTLRQALDLGFRRAWPSIRDANIATLLTSGILFWFGSSFGATIVKGFSVTLIIGVAISLFTALVVTRVFMQVTLENFKPDNYEKWFGI